MTRDEYLSELRGTYQFVSELSRHNGGQVLRLRHKTLKKEMILRLLPVEDHVYEMMCHFRCEGLCEVYDTVRLSDGMAVLTEYVDGIPLSEMMECVRYSQAEVRQIVKKVLYALSVLHERGLAHRDVKPANVILSKDGRVVLTDFDISRQVKQNDRDTRVMGTAGFASPEQLGVGESDARTDIYAAGVMLNLMLTGLHPTKAIAKGRMGRIIRKATAILPADRYQSAKKMADML